MRINTYKEPKSSFLSIEKDMNLILNSLLKNDRLKKLLYYTDENCLSNSNLNEDQTLELIHNNIKLTPKINIDKNVLNYLDISFDTFIPNENNPQFRDNLIIFDIICHLDQWTLKDFQLRPYRIAAEIDSMLNNTHLSGIGTLQFFGANQLMYNNEYGGLNLMYAAIHGEEDKKEMLNPNDNEQFLKDFKEMQNK